MKLSGHMETGPSREGTLNVNYNTIVDKVFKPNVTHLDDESKVPASWGFKDETGRIAYIWAYNYYGNINNCNSFSIAGDKSLLADIFGAENIN